MKPIKESRRLALLENKLGRPIKDILREWHWQKNLRHKDVGEKLGIPRPTITRWFKYFGVPSQSCTRFTNLNLLNVGPRKTPSAKPKIKKERPWTVNKSFFKKWSPEMAYVLGYLTADGDLFVNPRGSHYIAFTSTDHELIAGTRRLLASNHKIKKYEPSGNRKAIYRLQIGSKSMFRDLIRLGLYPNKSNTLAFLKIPHKYSGCFIRGYFDGDGCVTFKQYHRKGRKKKSWVFSVRFSSGSKKFLVGLKNHLSQILSGGFLYKKNRGYDLVYSTLDSKRLFHFMYHNVPPSNYLKRKYLIFKKAIKILGP